MLSVLRFLLRLKLPLILLMFISLPFIFWGASNSWQQTENRVEDWVPPNFEETIVYRQFKKIFGGDEILLITWPGCTIGSEQLQEFKDKLLAPMKARDGNEYNLFRLVITGTDLFEKLSDEDFRLDEQQIIDRMKGYLLAKDNQTTCLIALISKDGAKFRQDAVHGLWKFADSIPGLGAAKIHAAGPSMDSVCIDDMSRYRLIEMNLISYLIGIIISFWCFRNIHATLVVFGVSLLNQQICLALIYYLGITFDSILMLAVNLTFVLSMSVSIHLTNYYHEALTRYGTTEAVWAALHTALMPTFISVLTTAVGLMSFWNSQLSPIRRFGTLASLALLVSMAIIIVYIPLHYLMFPVKRWAVKDKLSLKNGKKSEEGETEGDTENIENTGSAALNSLTGSLGDAAPEGESKRQDVVGNVISWLFYPWVSRGAYLVLAVSLTLAVFCFWGTQHIQTRIGLSSMLRSYARPIIDYTWIEENIGPLIPVEIMVEFPSDETPTLLPSLHKIQILSQELKKRMPDSTVVSLLNFLPELPADGGGLRNIARKRAFDRILSSRKDQLSESGYFQELDGKQFWRITVRTFAMKKIDYGPIIAEIEATLKETLAQFDDQRRERLKTESSDVALIAGQTAVAEPAQSGSGSKPTAVAADSAAPAADKTADKTAADKTAESASGSKFLVSGGVPLVYRAQNQLLLDLKSSFLTAFVIIGLILMVLFRSAPSGALAVFPSLLPCIVIFGLVGTLGITVEMGTMLTGSAALGIAVDNTVHFITWFRIGYLRYGNRKQAVDLAFRRCGPAMFQTSMVCSLGLVAYMISPFIPTIYFSFFMFSLLTCALISDLTVLPAILIVSTGDLFLNKEKRILAKAKAENI